MSQPIADEYIHINEAVKKYNKTRQTFYNYIQKNLIRTIKRNNKTYLALQDIEQLLSDYIEPVTDPSLRSAWSTTPSTDLLLLEHVEQTGTEIIQQLRAAKQDIMFETKNISNQHEQKVVATVTHLLQSQQTKIDALHQFLTEHLAHYKKLRFWLAYACFLLVNIWIISLLP